MLFVALLHLQDISLPFELMFSNEKFNRVLSVSSYSLANVPRPEEASILNVSIRW